jgi:glutamyl-tRNA reductase
LSGTTAGKGQQISEAVILETCNRLEFYLYAKKDFDCAAFLRELISQVKLDATETWDKYSSQDTGVDVARHLFKVAAGLDSQMLGENQILSQVKSAYSESTDCRMSKLIFHRLFHSAFRVGKAVRTQTNINCGAVSIALAAVELARDRLDLSKSTAMVVGAGENAQLAARYLVKMRLDRLIIANRDVQKAVDIVSRLGGEAIGLNEIAMQLMDVDLLIASTAATKPIVTYEAIADTLADRSKPLLIIDIAVPRDIDPRIAEFESVTLINIDDLNAQVSSNKEKRKSEIPKAHSIVQEFAEKFSKWHESLDVIPVISNLLQKGLGLAQSEAKRYSKDFGQDNDEKLKSFAESLVRKVLHGPISFIKNGDEEELSAEQLQAVELINKMFLTEDQGN